MKKRSSLAHEPAEYETHEMAAVKALANDPRHQVALNWIIHKAAKTYDNPFRPGGHDGERASCFASGRMFVGQQIVKMINLPMPEKK